MDLETLAQEIKVCTKCPLYRSRTHAVPGEGKTDAEIMFIGEGPGSAEDETGRPFVGESGKFLDELLSSVGFKREDVFITSVVKCHPPHNRDPLEEEIRVCTGQYLFNQIKLIKPKLIVTLGRHAMQTFFPQLRSISAVHGKAYKKAGQVYLILYHPAAALHQAGLKETLKDDFRKIIEILKQIN